ncbi:MAG: hypothetical protein M3P50_06990 [Actinomycetota bacterium]|nr:hypothetical protein [Actinomycetota bacterium]
MGRRRHRPRRGRRGFRVRPQRERPHVR